MNLVKKSIRECSPVALLVRKGTFREFSKKIIKKDFKYLLREKIIEIILSHIPRNSIVVSTTGMASREVFEIREKMGLDHSHDFLTVGGMGHASQIAAGIAIRQPKRNVICIDGDGALLMHTGALAISSGCPNFLHILINNCAHDSVGGQPTKADSVSLAELAKVFGYAITKTISNETELFNALNLNSNFTESTFLEVMCSLGSRKDLGRPTKSPIQNKESVMQFLSTNE